MFIALVLLLVLVFLFLGNSKILLLLMLVPAVSEDYSMWLSLLMILVFLSITYNEKQTNSKLKMSGYLFLISSVSMILSESTLMMWLNMEIQSFSFMVAMLFNDKNVVMKMEALFKYFVMSTLSSFMMVFYQFLSIINSGNNYLFFHDYSSLESVSVLFMLMALLMKLGSFPMGMWVPEVFIGLSWVSMFYLMIIPKVTALLLLGNFMTWNSATYYIGLLSFLLGTVGLMNQTYLKKFMAWSGVANLGLMMLSMTELEKSNYTLMVYASMYFLSVILFTVYVLSSNKNNLVVEFMNSMGVNKMKMLMLLSLLLSFLGMPPLAGFLAKMLVFISVIQNSSAIFNLVLLMFVVMSSFIYLSVVTVTSTASKKNLFVWGKVTSNFEFNILLMMVYFLLFLFLNLDFFMGLMGLSL